MRELKLIFETHAAVESYEASKQFFSCMMEERSSVSEHMFAMSGHAKKLSDLGMMIPNQLGNHRVLQSLPPSYKNIVMNYNMQNMNKDLPELFSMLKSAEVEIKKENQVLMVNKTTSFKKQGKPNKGEGALERNCPKYLADLKSGHVKKKGTRRIKTPERRTCHGEEQWDMKMITKLDTTLLEALKGREERWPVQDPVRLAPQPGHPVPGPVNRAPNRIPLHRTGRKPETSQDPVGARSTGPRTGPPGHSPV
ncbi:hypothetical protein QYE76_001226 [Lolium multiflorum]|uniref:Uncharacterized protein n=1 Tax=Lolium multiflorum TaxID=4521 RepID=A0AAD8VZH6_LOLMU|nr:hypothetical protein QYE76_001226 [Lolium multiflorum]